AQGEEVSPPGPGAGRGWARREAPRATSAGGGRPRVCALAAAVAAVGLRELFAEDLGEGLLFFGEAIVALAVLVPDVFFAPAEAEAAALVLGGVGHGGGRELVEQGAHALHDAVEHGDLVGGQVVEGGLEGLGGLRGVLAEVEQGGGDRRG